MKKFRFFLKPMSPALLAAGLCLLQPALAQTPADLSDLVGARGSSGETQMEARGYALVRATQVRDQSWTFWWSNVQRQCVAISTTDGRYAAISNIPAQNCQPGGAAAPAQVPVAPPSNVLTLVCYGEGEHAAFSSHTDYVWNKDRKRYEPTQRMESGTEHFNSGVQIDIQGNQGRIHLTGKMIPPLNSGGSDGWWALNDLRVEQDRITANYQVNAFNRMQMNVDRRTGLIELKGMGAFNGKCDAGDWGNGRKF